MLDILVITDFQTVRYVSYLDILVILDITDVQTDISVILDILAILDITDFRQIDISGI